MNETPLDGTMTSFGSRPVRDDHPPGTVPAEASALHTRIMRCMLAVDDSYAYWKYADPSVPAADRARVAFEQRWFGTKSEARVRTLMTDMLARFDAYPEAFALLRRLPAVPARIRPLICHIHMQLADPIYRRFAGDLLPERRAHGYTSVDRRGVARWVDDLAPGRWSRASLLKFASNLLTTAMEAGLVRGRRDPRELPMPRVPDVVLAYALYLLRGVRIDGALTDNPYLRSLGVAADAFGTHAARLPGLRYAELGGVGEIHWEHATMTAWGLEHLGGDA